MHPCASRPVPVLRSYIPPFCRLTHHAERVPIYAHHDWAACCSAAMSIFFILSIASMTRCDFLESGSASSLLRIVGTICHDRPYLSFNQPHAASWPPSVSFAQNSSTSCCVSQFTTSEIASVNLNC